MSSSQQGSLSNQLLKLLSPDDFALVHKHLEPVELDRGMVLIEPDRAIPYLVFPDSGLGSVIAISSEGQKSEVGLFGFDGLSGIPLLLGLDRMPIECLMQVAGAGHRIEAAALGDLMDRSRSLRGSLLPFIQTFMVQTSHTALANARHTVEERLGRWLLMCHDRMPDDHLLLTHDFLALMLGVRRPSVTTALHVIEGMGLVRNTRASIVIRDRPALESFASASYGIPEAEYERVIGPLRKRVSVRDQPDSSVVAFKRDASGD